MNYILLREEMLNAVHCRSLADERKPRLAIAAEVISPLNRAVGNEFCELQILNSHCSKIVIFCHILPPSIHITLLATHLLN